jgi:hypothetical protein
MTETNASGAGGGTNTADLSDPAAKTQPAEGGREEVDEGFDPESSGESAASLGWSEQEDSSTPSSNP